MRASPPSSASRSQYLRKLRAEYPDLYDTNINMWLHGKVRRAGGVTEVVRAADRRTFFIRLFRGDNGDGVARALLSDRYKPMDNLDVLTAVLQAVQESGVDAEVVNANLTDRTMYVDVAAPQVAALAPVLLGGYRNPFDDPNIDAARRAAGRPDSELGYWRRVAHHDGMGYDPGTEPIVFAGFRIRNCEVGGGAFSARAAAGRAGVPQRTDPQPGRAARGPPWRAPRARAGELVGGDPACSARAGHVQDPRRGRHVPRPRLPPHQAGEDRGRRQQTPVDNPVKTVALVGKTCGFTDAEIDGVLGFFTRGGQMTAGGVTNAITAFSQTVIDADRATELDAQALRAMELVA